MRTSSSVLAPSLGFSGLARQGSTQLVGQRLLLFGESGSVSDSMQVAPPLDESAAVLHALQQQAASGKKLLLMFDFDGTLVGDRTSISDGPIAKELRANILALSKHPNVQVAIITARKLSQIFSTIPELETGNHNIKLVGMLNAELYDCATQAWLKRTDNRNEEAIGRAFQSLIDQGLVSKEPEELNPIFYRGTEYPDIHIENKGSALVLHYKTHDQARIVGAFNALIDQVNPDRENPDFKLVTTGHQMSELVPIHYNKADGVQMVRDLVADENPETEFFPVYVGDSPGSDGPGFVKAEELGGMGLFVRKMIEKGDLPDGVAAVVPSYQAVHGLVKAVTGMPRVETTSLPQLFNEFLASAKALLTEFLERVVAVVTGMIQQVSAQWSQKTSLQ